MFCKKGVPTISQNSQENNCTRVSFLIRLHTTSSIKAVTHLLCLLLLEAVAQTCSVKKVFLDMSQNWQENTCARVSFLIKLQALPATLLNKKETLAQVFSCEFCEISKITFFLLNTSCGCFWLFASSHVFRKFNSWNLFDYDVQVTLTISCIMLKDSWTCFKNLAVFTGQNV